MDQNSITVIPQAIVVPDWRKQNPGPDPARFDRLERFWARLELLELFRTILDFVWLKKSTQEDLWTSMDPLETWHFET